MRPPSAESARWIPWPARAATSIPMTTARHPSGAPRRSRRRKPAPRLTQPTKPVKKPGLLGKLFGRDRQRAVRACLRRRSCCSGEPFAVHVWRHGLCRPWWQPGLVPAGRKRRCAGTLAARQHQRWRRSAPASTTAWHVRATGARHHAGEGRCIAPTTAAGMWPSSTRPRACCWSIPSA